MDNIFIIYAMTLRGGVILRFVYLEAECISCALRHRAWLLGLLQIVTCFLQFWGQWLVCPRCHVECRFALYVQRVRHFHADCVERFICELHTVRDCVRFCLFLVAQCLVHDEWFIEDIEWLLGWAWSIMCLHWFVTDTHNVHPCFLFLSRDVVLHQMADCLGLQRKLFIGDVPRTLLLHYPHVRVIRSSFRLKLLRYLLEMIRVNCGLLLCLERIIIFERLFERCLIRCDSSRRFWLCWLVWRLELLEETCCNGLLLDW